MVTSLGRPSFHHGGAPSSTGLSTRTGLHTTKSRQSRGLRHCATAEGVLRRRRSTGGFRERLPASRWAQGEALLAEFERRHRELLVRRRAALEKLSELTAQTLDQVGRRLAILDEEYGFIRTHIFWVRDQEPIGLTTLNQGVRDLQRLATALGRLVQETTRHKLGGRPSAEFLIAAVAVLGLPLGLVRLRRTLRSLIQVV